VEGGTLRTTGKAVKDGQKSQSYSIESTAYI